MRSPTEFYEVVSGKRRGLMAILARLGLRSVEVPYTWAVKYRNYRFDSGTAATHRVSVPVISVGNLTLGGTGKTPMVAWLADWFNSQNVSVAIVSRGYGSSNGQTNDEYKELNARLPGVPHIQNPDRVAGAQSAIDQGAQIVLLDDGFQHRRLERELDIVLIDALQPTGYDHVFPRGCLREPMDGIRRADVIIVTRSDMVSQSAREQIRSQIQSLTDDAIWLEASHAPTGLVSASGVPDPTARLASERVAAFCGIGNPQGFRNTLHHCQCEAVRWREFPDHHEYSKDDLDEIAAMAKQSDASLLVCTQKDLVKINQEQLGTHDLRALQIEMTFDHSEELSETLKRFLP